MKPLIFLLWTSSNICPGFQSQGGFPCLNALSPVHNGFLRFTCSVTPADLLVASMAAEPFDPHTCIQALVGLESSVPCLTACDKTDVLPNELSWFGSFVKCWNTT